MSEVLPDRLPGQARGNRLNDHGATHGTDRPTAHGTWRTQCAPACGTVAGIDFR